MKKIIKQASIWLARFLGGAAIIWLLLGWMERQTQKRETAARASGIAACEAEQARKEVNQINQKLENQKNAELKKMVIWTEPNLDDADILQLFDNNEL